MTAIPTSETAMNAAVDWLVRQESAALSDADRQAFEHWLNTDTLHRAAWERVSTALTAPLSTVRELRNRADGVHVQAAMQALFQKRRRRVLRGALSVAGVGVTAAWVADRFTPLGQISADLRTGTGERRDFTLADGSAVLLDARSAVDVHNASGAPQLQLRAGALIVSRPPTGAAPLGLHTRDGLALLNSGRMMGRLHADRTDIVAMDHSVTLQTRATGTHLLRAGEGASFDARSVTPLSGHALHRTAWQQGMLAVDDWSLVEVVHALQAYSPGFLRVAPDVARLRVFGIFRLDVDMLLATLSETLPIQVRRLGPLISIEGRTGR